MAVDTIGHLVGIDMSTGKERLRSELFELYGLHSGECNKKAPRKRGARKHGDCISQTELLLKGAFVKKVSQY